MSVVSFLVGASGECGKRELANCCNGYRNTPPGWVWREHAAGGALNLVRELDWRRQGAVGAQSQVVFGDVADVSPQQATLAMGRRHSASFQQLGIFENMCGGRLPRDYVEFLLYGDFAAPLERFFDVTEDGETALETVQCFLGFGFHWPVGNLDYVLQLYAGGAPVGIVPIAGNGAGDYICLDLRSGDTARRASVSLWRIGHFWRSGVWREQDLLPLADSFSNFIADLRAAPRKGVTVAQRRTLAADIAGAPGALFRQWSA